MSSLVAAPSQPTDLIHRFLDSGVELGVDLLPQRNTVSLYFRLLTGLMDDPEPLTGISTIVERTLSKGTERFDGRGLADAFDRLGASWGSVSGRQSTLVRVLCLPEFAAECIELVGEMLVRPTFPEDACRVAVDLARQELQSMEDEPQELLRAAIQRLTLGPNLGRHPGGTFETLTRIDRDEVHAHWQRCFVAGRLQVAVAGPVDVEAIAQQVDATFVPLGRPEQAGRAAADFAFTPARSHQAKPLEQEYIAITLPGRPRGHQAFAVEQVLLRIFSGGMSGRLFTEVREKQGLVYWVGAWHEQPRGHGVIHLGASTTPDRCQRTYDTLLRELERLGEDITEEEFLRARDGLIAHYETEDDLTRARAGSLSDDLFHFSEPVGLARRLAAIRSVSLAQVSEYARALPRDQLCVATIGPTELR